MTDERVQRILVEFETSIQQRTGGMGQQNTVPVASALFHYTDAAGLKGILEKDCLWLTDRIHLTDAPDTKVQRAERWAQKYNLATRAAPIWPHRALFADRAGELEKRVT
jgi:hypothetical protein